MKKIYKLVSLIAFVALSNGAMAQTTITAAAIPHIGYIYYEKADTVATDMANFTISAGSASAQTWNYTSQWGTLYNDTTAFVAASSGAGASNFTGASMASKVGTTWAYWITNAGGLFIDGVYASIQGTPTAIDFTPNPVQIPTPFTYTSTPVVSNYTATFLVGGIATVKHRAKRTITADAFGSLTIPSGTYPNTLRTKTYEITSDSAFVFGNFSQAQYDTTTEYAWSQNSPDAHLMSINKDHTGKITKASYLQLFLNGVASVSAPSASFNLFPNPAASMTNFTYENKTTGMVNIQLIDLSGKQVAVLVNEQQAIGKQKISINLEALHLPKGMYFLQLNSNNNLQTIKLTLD